MIKRNGVHLAALAALVGIACLFITSAAHALPMYAARAGRTCDNCHSLPNTWEDPSAISERKCTLSCVGCHVDPNGGGLRTVSGRYYGENTLPMFRAEARPLDDRERAVWDLFTGSPAERDIPSSQAIAAPSSQAIAAPSSQAIAAPSSQAIAAQAIAAPSSQAIAESHRPGAPPADAGWLSFGRPLAHGAKMAWLDGRYGDRNADPLLQLGADLRFAFWSAGSLFFPMQLDLHGALHPVEHLTLAGTVGARGRRASPVFNPGGAADAEQPRFGVRDLYVMTHEWPALSHLRAGRFMPAFGLRLADHTAYTRRPFGMSMEDPANRVIGVEAGFAANYPHLTASLFKPSTAAAESPFDLGDGWGAAVDAGWRDLEWQIGASAMIRRRPLAAGGDTTDLALHWGYNPWRRWSKLPLTYIGEVAGGALQRPFSGNGTHQLAWYHELGWLAANGLALRLRYDTWDPDFEVRDDVMHRPGAGIDVHLVPGLTVSADARVGLPAGGEGSADVLIQIHGWL